MAMWDANELKASQSKVPHVTCSDLVWRRHVSRIWCILSSPLCCSVLYTASRPTNRQDDLRVRTPCTRPDLTPTRRRRAGVGWSVSSGGNLSCWVDRERASQVWPILCWAGDLLTISTTPGPSTSATGWRYGGDVQWTFMSDHVPRREPWAARTPVPPGWGSYRHPPSLSSTRRASTPALTTWRTLSGSSPTWRK